MKNVNNFQIAKVQPQGVAYCLICWQFQPGVAYKSGGYKKSVYGPGEHNSVQLLVPGND